jgi:1,4-alpha-glucan branching enzyme
VLRLNYRIGAPYGGEWKEILNSDAKEYWGEGYGNQGAAIAEQIPYHGQPFSLNLTLPPLGTIYLKHR